MSADTLVTITHPAAHAAAPVLAAYAPTAWPLAAPYLDTLFYALDNGHSFIALDKSAVQTLRAASPLVGAAGDFTPLVLHDAKLFLGRLWQLEQDIAVDLWRLAHSDVVQFDTAPAAASLAAWFTGTGSTGQQAAAALALLQPLMLINGGPGTGKTTTVAKLLALICQHGAGDSGSLPRIALAAPTGKAAAHMAQALQAALTRFDAPSHIQYHLRHLSGQTVHRLLGLRFPLLQSTFDADHPLPLDVLVVDEASMLDLSLLRTLLRALRSGTRLILLGDHNQLPAVGAGDVLGALAQPTQVDDKLAAQLAQLLPRQTFMVNNSAPPLASHIATLTVSHRFDDNSGIGCLAAAVVAGQGEAAVATFARFTADLHWADAQQIRQPWPQLYRIQAAYWQAVAQQDATAAFAALKQVVVLAAWRQDAADFNQRYRDYLAQHGHRSQDNWFAGQVLMVTQNDYGSGLYNGDIGIVLPDGDGLAAYFADDGGFRTISLGRLPEHDTAFAMTVHKSQGSEYEQVWLLPPSGDDEQASLFDRALLYTALTRARQRFVFLGAPAQLHLATQRVGGRRSGLKAALSGFQAA